MAETAWRALGADEAKAHPLYGYKGWLVLFHVLAVVLFLLSLRSALSAGAIMMWETVEQVMLMRWVMLVQCAALLPFIVLSPLRHPEAARVGLWGFWFYAALPVIAVWLLLDISGAKVAAVTGYNAVLTVIFSVYLLRSQRVNVTFRHRIKAAA